jgi:hypothetical protein
MIGGTLELSIADCNILSFHLHLPRIKDIWGQKTDLKTMYLVNIVESDEFYGL